MNRQPQSKPQALVADQAPLRAKPSNYPPEVVAMLQSVLAGREKRPLGDLFGLTNFGVNLTTLAPGAASSIRHAHSMQDEFIYIVSGTPTLVTDEGRSVLSPGMCAGFKAGSGNAHQLVNESPDPVMVLEVGDRTDGDTATYPEADLLGRQQGGQWLFFRKNGEAF
ncbi:cupin domain-containing protein [Limnohabitans sp. T6-20]|uniref:cupin domain-containing protein n=1 Tax=Limnohabitans sp. T6-20 TaxID=1100725 RepID=UPI000D3C34C5|nr:cupin domain-containing protein [Limnohabitans sp. T6-20]PUE13046.1 cupin [Limnohabitans sp. T6-20]